MPPQMVPSSNSLGNCCYRITWRMINSFFPSPSVLQSTCSQHILTNLIYLLGLSIGREVISRTEIQMGVQGSVQSFPELQNKLGSSSGHNPNGHSMQIGYLRPIQPYQLRYSVCHFDGYEVSYLGQLVHNYRKGNHVQIES
jgi:hypothetical protein